MKGSEDLPVVHAIRFSECAASQMEAEHERIVVRSDAASADEWEDDLVDKIATLATLPERCPIAPENDLFQRINPGYVLRLFLYRRTRTGPAWRVLFSVAPANDADPPTVQVQCIQHSAQAPMTEWPSSEETP